ncbi:MAG: ferritin family protein [Planctomycetales bacterium]|nr:ferritin family protein [Planctomycetales bacterium]
MRHLRSIRDILDYAIEQEAEANLLYGHLALYAQRAELKAALEKFAADEFVHKLRLEGVRDGQVELTPEEVGTLNIAPTLKPVRPGPDMTLAELLAYAIQKESEAEQLYSRLAGLSRRDDVKKLFTLLAQEEARHKLAFEIEYDLTTF